MLDIKFIREQAEFVKESLAKRHMETDIIDSVIALDENDANSSSMLKAKRLNGTLSAKKLVA